MNPSKLASWRVAATDGGDGSRDLGPHGPNLPPKTPSPKLLPKPARTGKRIPPTPGGPGGPQSQRTLGGMAVYTGVVGTSALVLSQLAGIDVWSQFDWSDMGALQAAALVSIPLQAANAGLLLPSYSTWKLPDLTEFEAARARAGMGPGPSGGPEAPPADPNALSSAAAATPASSSAPASTSASASTSSPDPAGAPAGPASPAGPSEAQPASPATPLAADPSAAEGASPSAAPGAGAGAPSPLPPLPPPPPLPPGVLPASAWGSRPPAPPLDTAAIKEALHLAQGYYLSNNPTARLTPGAEAAWTVLDTAAGELLYRGVALTWLARWLEDRAYEAGLGDSLAEQLPALAGRLGGEAAAAAVTQLGVLGFCQASISALVVSYVAIAVLSRSRRAAARVDALIGAASAAAAARKAKGKGKDKEVNADEAAARKRVQVVLGGPGGAAPLTGGAGVVLQRAAAVQAARDGLQVGLLNLVFIASGGNLAASWAASLANQLLISAMQRRGLQRLRERSSALAKELGAYNAELQRIAAKHKAVNPPAASTSASASTSAPADAAAAPSTSGSPPAPLSTDATDPAAASAAAAASALASTSAAAPAEQRPTAPRAHDAASSSTSAASAAVSAADASAVPTATASAPLPSVAAALDAAVAGAAPAALSIESGGEEAASGAGGAAASAEVDAGVDVRASSSSSLTRALGLLDALLPEPPKAAAAGAGAGPGAAAAAGPSPAAAKQP